MGGRGLGIENKCQTPDLSVDILISVYDNSILPVGQAKHWESSLTSFSSYLIGDPIGSNFKICNSPLPSYNLVQATLISYLP